MVVPRFLALMIVTALFNIYALLFGIFGGVLATLTFAGGRDLVDDELRPLRVGLVALGVGDRRRERAAEPRLALDGHGDLRDRLLPGVLDDDLHRRVLREPLVTGERRVLHAHGELARRLLRVLPLLAAAAAAARDERGRTHERQPERGDPSVRGHSPQGAAQLTPQPPR
ncbi:MAG: ABC transporter permease [Actinobacteria bacterium]|nr:ABC transporter permease [Actinomycetota bacterium]